MVALPCLPLHFVLLHPLLVQSILPLKSMTDFLLPDYTQIPKTVSDVADNLNRGRRVGGLWRNFANGQKQLERGFAYMDASRVTIQQCRPLMDSEDRQNIDAVYNV